MAKKNLPTPVTVCDCAKYPVMHDARWCFTLPTLIAWDEFEANTLREWANKG